MLTFLDKLLEAIFAYGPPIAIGIWGVVACILFLGVLCGRADGKWNILGQLGVHIVCVWGFFKWYAEMKVMPQPEGYSHVPAVVAMFVFIAVIGISWVLVNIARIPAFLVFLLFLGIAIWGV